MGAFGALQSCAAAGAAAAQRIAKVNRVSLLATRRSFEDRGTV
jgi:hypothetical protein